MNKRKLKIPAAKAALSNNGTHEEQLTIPDVKSPQEPEFKAESPKKKPKEYKQVNGVDVSDTMLRDLPVRPRELFKELKKQGVVTGSLNQYIIDAFLMRLIKDKKASKPKSLMDEL